MPESVLDSIVFTSNMGGLSIYESTTIRHIVAAKMGLCRYTIFRVEATHHNIVDALQANHTNGSNPFDSDVRDSLEIEVCFGVVSQSFSLVSCAMEGVRQCSLQMLLLNLCL